MSSIHDATPLQLAELVKRRERLARIASRAMPVEPVREILPEIIIGPQHNEHCREYCWHLYIQNHEALRGITIDRIKRAVARDCNLSIIELISDRRLAQLVQARQIAMYLAKRLTAHSLPAIGRQFGGRDHSTVHHAVHQIERLIQTDPILAARIEAIRNTLGE